MGKEIDEKLHQFLRRVMSERRYPGRHDGLREELAALGLESTLDPKLSSAEARCEFAKAAKELT